MLNFKPKFTDRLALRAECAALVGYTPAPLSPDAPTVPEEGQYSTFAVDDDVTVFRAGQLHPRTGTVKAIRPDGQLLVQFGYGACLCWVWSYEVIETSEAI